MQKFITQNYREPTERDICSGKLQKDKAGSCVVPFLLIRRRHKSSWRLLAQKKQFQRRVEEAQRYSGRRNNLARKEATFLFLAEEVGRGSVFHFSGEPFHGARKEIKPINPLALEIFLRSWQPSNCRVSGKCTDFRKATRNQWNFQQCGTNFSQGTIVYELTAGKASRTTLLFNLLPPFFPTLRCFPVSLLTRSWYANSTAFVSL